MLGTYDSMMEVSRVETWALPDESHIKFGSAMEGFLPIEKGEKAEVRTFVNEEDEAALIKSIRDARRRSDAVIVSLHTHEGINENWYAPIPPSFVEEYAHKAIDAGADAFVGHGAHYARGIEIYKGHPIFYNLGSLIMEFEAGNSMISSGDVSHISPSGRCQTFGSSRQPCEESGWKLERFLCGAPLLPELYGCDGYRGA